MPVEQMNISMSPQMARFIRSKVKAGGYTNISEVVRTAIRRMQKAEAHEARSARTLADDILAEISVGELETINEQVQRGFETLDRGEYTDYLGREGLAQLASGVKARGRKLLANTTPLK